MEKSDAAMILIELKTLNLHLERIENALTRLGGGTTKAIEVFGKEMLETLRGIEKKISDRS